MKRTTLLLILMLSPFGSAYAMMQNSPYALVFFFRSDCPYCHSFSSTLKQFTDINRMQTYAFSLNGKALAEFPVPIPATPDISRLFFENPRSITVPATFLINVNTRKFVKVSIGDVSYDQLNQSVHGILNDPLILEAME